MSGQQTEIAVASGITDPLVGITLASGWTIAEALPKPKEGEGTGSFFSSGYTATKNGTKAFLKAIDIAKVVTEKSPIPLMQRLGDVTSNHNFECTLLDICQKAKLDRIVSILDRGQIDLPPGAGLGIPIPFILFEWLDGGDLRKAVSRSDKIDDAIKLAILHHVAMGIQQLHSNEIAHQDLKPSNVLLYADMGKGAKICDLGRSSSKGHEATHDNLDIAGAQIYAPPEQFFGIRPEAWVDRREACDLYHLGTLLSFLFSGLRPNDYYLQELAAEVRPKAMGGNGQCDYATALPALTLSFNKYVSYVQQSFPEWAREELTQILLNACDPNFEQRGDPKARQQVGKPIGIQSFVSRFDRLSKAAAIESRK